MITPSFALTATERVLPKLALDFTTASLDQRVTFIRTTDATHPATYVNSSGYITAATNNQPRFDYDPVTLACKGLLLEEGRTNIAAQSNNFSAAAWTSVALTVTGNTTDLVAPDNTNSACKVMEAATSNVHAVINTSGISVSSSTVYAASLFIKAINKQYVQVVFDNMSTTAGGYANFDLTNGTVTASANYGAATGISAGITAYKNGWYRIHLTTTPQNTVARFAINAINSGTAGVFPGYVGDTSRGYYLWGAQVEPGSFPTSFIPNPNPYGTTTTRNADVATMTGTNFSSWWTATNGASDIWLIPKSTTTLAYVSFDDNSANNKIVIANNTTSGQSTITSGGISQATLTAGTITANALNKVGCSWNTNNCAATANATTPATTSSATIPTVTQLRIGSNGTAYANAWLQKLFYWPQRIANNEIQAFTK